MEKSDKELAVDLAIAYVQAWFSNGQYKKPMTGDEVAKIVKDCYSAVSDLGK